MSTDQPMRPDAITVDSETAAPGVAVIRPRGDVDTATVARLRGEFAERVAAGDRHVVLDLSGVEFLGSAGLALLVEQREAAVGRNAVLCLAAVPRAVARPLKITGLQELFATYDDVDTAVTELSKDHG